MRRLMLTGMALLVTGCDAGAPRVANEAASADNIVIAATGTRARESAAATKQAAEATAASIPAKFRGIWAEDRAACAQLPHHSRLIISERVIRYPSLVLVSESIDLPTDSSLAVSGHNQRTGAPAEAHYSIDATGLILTDEAGGGAVRMKCG